MRDDKTGLTAYRDNNKTIYAAKITQITAFDAVGLPGCVRLEFSDIGKVALLKPDWKKKNNPVVGDYFTVANGEASIIAAKNWKAG